MKIYTIKEACQELKLCRQTLYTLIQKGEISAKKVGSKWLVNGDSIDRFLNEDQLQIEKFFKRT